MQRSIFFIDGFNLYHSIADNKELSKFKWLNLKKLCSSLMTKNETLVKIFYFTARAVKNTFPQKNIKVILPPNRRSESLKAEAHFHTKLKMKHLLGSQFPDKIEINGLKLEKPKDWY